MFLQVAGNKKEYEEGISVSDLIKLEDVDADGLPDRQLYRRRYRE